MTTSAEVQEPSWGMVSSKPAACGHQHLAAPTLLMAWGTGEPFIACCSAASGTSQGLGWPFKQSAQLVGMHSILLCQNRADRLLFGVCLPGTPASLLKNAATWRLDPATEMSQWLALRKSAVMTIMTAMHSLVHADNFACQACMELLRSPWGPSTATSTQEQRQQSMPYLSVTENRAAVPPEIKQDKQ